MQINRLRWTLRSRTIRLLLGVAIIAGSIFSATLLPPEFVPPADTGRVNISLELPPGSSMDETRAAARAVTRLVREIPEIPNVFVNASSDTKANITVNLCQKADRGRSSFVIQDQITAMLADFPDVRLTVLSLLFVPSLFSVIDSLKTGGRSLLVHTLGANQPAPKQRT